LCVKLRTAKVKGFGGIAKRDYSIFTDRLVRRKVME
jgi:hypothetical protein